MRWQRARRGFTLLEMMVVMIILTIAAALIAPALTGLGVFNKVQTTTSIFLQLLHDARQFAIQHNVTVMLEMDPKTGRFRADTTGVGGTGIVREDSLYLGASEAIETANQRVHYIFFPSGGAFADSVTIRGSDSTRAIFVDAFSGVAFTRAR